MARLEDAFNSSMTKPKKLLDLSKIKIFSFEDYEKYIDKIPNLNLTPEKITPLDIKTISTDFSFTLPNKDRLELDLGTSDAYYLYGDPVPFSMRAVRFADLFSVDIHWKMLTDYRPVNRVEEEYFNRMVNLGKFRRDSKISEANVLAASLSSVPGAGVQGKALAMGFITYKSKRGTVETKLKSCKDCGLELCTGVFCQFQLYECYSRVILDKDELEAEDKNALILKSVIDHANAMKKPGATTNKVSKKKDNKPSLTAMIYMARKSKKKKKKKKNQAIESKKDGN